MNQTGIVTLFSPGFNLIRGDLIRAERHTRVLNQGPPSTRSSKGCSNELHRWCPLARLFSPGFNLNLCVFPSHREGLGMGFQNGMGVWGKGQLEHVSDGELLNSTLWITFGGVK